MVTVLSVLGGPLARISELKPSDEAITSRQRKGEDFSWSSEKLDSLVA